MRPHEGNGCAERFIGTLKENLLWVQTFDTAKELRRTLIEFQHIYNSTWLVERHEFRPPDAIRAAQLPPAAGTAGASTKCFTNRERYTRTLTTP